MQHFLSYIEQIPHIHVLCLGDMMLDCFVYGKVERISPEAPVPIFSQAEEKFMLGGVGNVLTNIISLGAQASFIGYVGDDERGSQVCQLLKDAGCRTHIIPLPDCPTIQKTRLIANNNHVLRLDKEKVVHHGLDAWKKLQDVLEAEIARADIVLLSDYAKGSLNRESTPYIIELCNKYDKKVMIDPKGVEYDKYRHATLVKPNLKEFSQATQMEFNPKADSFMEDVKRGAQKLFTEHGIKNILVTLSEHGMVFISQEKPDELIKIPTEARDVFDVSGAGDTSLAMLGIAVAAGAPMKDAMRLANIASGIVIGKLGTASTTREEMLEQIQHKNRPLMGLARKIVTMAEAQGLAQQAQREGLIVGFTNGCFDLMHLGHLHSFSEAKKHCDILCVGVNSDACIKRYKGPDRPIQDEQTRASLVAALEFVDYVIVFEEDVPMNLIEAIHPDVIAKEGYAVEDWPEAQYVQAYGGQAVTLPRLEGYSTTASLSKILS